MLFNAYNFSLSCLFLINFTHLVKFILECFGLLFLKVPFITSFTLFVLR